MMGPTDPVDAAPGTIRGDFALSQGGERRARLRQPGQRRARDRPVLQRRGACLASALSWPRARRSAICCCASSASRFRTVVSAHPEEIVAGEPWRTAEHNAAGKAREVLGRERLGSGELVLGVDTIVVVDGRVLGKAADEEQARAYLAALAGRAHEVDQRPVPRRRDGVERLGHARHGGDLPALGAARDRRATSAPASGASAPAPTPYRVSGRPSSRRVERRLLQRRRAAGGAARRRSSPIWGSSRSAGSAAETARDRRLPAVGERASAVYYPD